MPSSAPWILGLSTLLAAAPGVQAPYAAWNTLPTAHYRIHYPPMLSGWAQEVAGRIEGVHASVTALVGYESPEIIQVVLADPMQESNGMAVSLLEAPFVMLWATEPRSDSLTLGSMTSWTDLLLSHELTHIHHLTRPARKATPFRSLFQLPVGPLDRKVPRWVAEGYATLAEGRITGQGRPHSAVRAAILRQWAQAGKLPAYKDLDSFRGFLGGNMAYMVGSAYLEWLERSRPAHPDILQRFWKQLASAKGLRFKTAFRATFGFSVQDGYQRFQAELAHDALECERQFKAQGLRQGELWWRAPGNVSDLAVSPDGTRLLARVQEGVRSGLRVWELSPKSTPPQAPKHAPDPFNDVEDARPEFSAHKLLASLPMLNKQVPQEGQWVDDSTILFQLKHPDRDGSLHRRPALWHLKDGVEQAPASLPSPRWKTLDPVHRQGRWVLEMEGQPVPLPGQAVGRAFVDEPRSQLLAACELEGVWNIVMVPYRRKEGTLRFEAAQALTRTNAAAWNPAPSPDGRWLYFTSLDPRGMEIRKLDLTLPPLNLAPAPEARLLNQAAVMPPALEANALPAPVAPPASRSYRASENLLTAPSGGATVTPAGTSYQVGVAGSDLLGRLTWQVLAGFGDGAGPRGASLGLASAAWPWKPSLNVFTALERPSCQPTAPVQRDRERRGLEWALEWDDLGAPRWWVSPVLAWEHEELLPQPGTSRTQTRGLAGLRTGLIQSWARGPWSLTLTPAVDFYGGTTRLDTAAGESGGGSQSWNASRAKLTVALDTPLATVTFKGESGHLAGGGLETFHLGGLTSSLIPRSLEMNRLEQAALPAYSAEGDRFRSYRGEIRKLVSVYLEGDALWTSGQGRGPFQRVLGVEYALDIAGPSDRLYTRNIKLELGVHRPLDGIMKDRTVATLSLVVRP